MPLTKICLADNLYMIKMFLNHSVLKRVYHLMLSKTFKTTEKHAWSFTFESKILTYMEKTLLQMPGYSF